MGDRLEFFLNSMVERPKEHANLTITRIG
jgi:hypothetical protein